MARQLSVPVSVDVDSAAELRTFKEKVEEFLRTQTEDRSAADDVAPKQLSVIMMEHSVGASLVASKEIVCWVCVQLTVARLV